MKQVVQAFPVVDTARLWILSPFLSAAKFWEWDTVVFQQGSTEDVVSFCADASMGDEIES